MAEYPTHVEQALNELDNALRLGSADAEQAGRKRLAAAGVDPDKALQDRVRTHAAAQRRAALQADSSEQARSSAPQGRATKADAKQVTTAEKKG